MDDKIKLIMSQEEAIIFFAWLSRFNTTQNSDFEDQAEQRVLWNIEASLESLLQAPFSFDYKEILESARAKLRDSTE